MLPPARIGDTITHDKLVPSGVIGPPMPGATLTVIIEGMPAACLGDFVTCTGMTTPGPMHPPQAGPPPAIPPSMPIVAGSATVLIGGRPAARWISDTGGCGAFLGDEKLLLTRKVFVG
jgi:uncharacterized Zn-binding protein involved in type VI secretion